MKTLKQYICEAATKLYDIGPVQLRSGAISEITAAFSKFNKKDKYVSITANPDHTLINISCGYTTFKKKDFINILCDCAEKYGDSKIYEINVAGVPRKDISNWMTKNGYDTDYLVDIVRKERFYCIEGGITTKHFREFLNEFMK